MQSCGERFDVCRSGYRCLRAFFAYTKTNAAATAIFIIFMVPRHATACWNEAAQRYGVNPNLLYAIAKTESNLNPLAVKRNKNGSYDIGMMQINSRWLPILRPYGIEERQLYDPCVSIGVGAWILAQNTRRLGNSWNAVGAYNTTDPERRFQYAMKVYKNLPPALYAAR